MKLKKLKLNERMYFKAEIRAEQISADKRTIDLSFASNVPYLRSFGYEIININTIDFTRLNNGAVLLFNHDWDDYLGKIEKTWVDGSKAYATVSFDTHERAEQIYQSVLNGTLHQVSVGYEINKARTVDAIDDIDAYEVDITPHEISIVTVPADISVGVGRNMETEDEEEKPEESVEGSEEEIQEEIEEDEKTLSTGEELSKKLDNNESVLEIIEKSLDNKANNVNLIMELSLIHI
jgi:HK97 family phage prohead protease